MRELKISHPPTASSRTRAAENDYALRQIETVLKGNLTGFFLDTPGVFRRAKRSGAAPRRRARRRGPARPGVT